MQAQREQVGPPRPQAPLQAALEQGPRERAEPAQLAEGQLWQPETAGRAQAVQASAVEALQGPGSEEAWQGKQQKKDRPAKPPPAGRQQQAPGQGLWQGLEQPPRPGQHVRGQQQQLGPEQLGPEQLGPQLGLEQGGLQPA